MPGTPFSAVGITGIAGSGAVGDWVLADGDAGGVDVTTAGSCGAVVAERDLIRKVVRPTTSAAATMSTAAMSRCRLRSERRRLDASAVRGAIMTTTLACPRGL